MPFQTVLRFSKGGKMAAIKVYRMLCRNAKCGGEFLRSYRVDEFQQNQDGSGWHCFNCGYPRMQCYVSNRKINDKLQFPSFQRNIGEYCHSEADYKRKLKEKGLIELGFEDFPEREEEAIGKRYWTDDVIKELAEEGITFDGELIKAMQSGKLDLDDSL